MTNTSIPVPILFAFTIYPSSICNYTLSQKHKKYYLSSSSETCEIGAKGMHIHNKYHIINKNYFNAPNLVFKKEFWKIIVA